MFCKCKSDMTDILANPNRISCQTSSIGFILPSNGSSITVSRAHWGIEAASCGIALGTIRSTISKATVGLYILGVSVHANTDLNPMPKRPILSSCSYFSLLK